MSMVTATTAPRLLVASDGGEPVPLDATLTYDIVDPFAVEIVFHSGGYATIWILDRALLAAGMHGPSGSGDIHVSPVDSDDRSAILISLITPEGNALIEFDRADIGGFLARSYTACPAGTESDLINWDAFVLEVLGS